MRKVEGEEEEGGESELSLVFLEFQHSLVCKKLIDPLVVRHFCCGFVFSLSSRQVFSILLYLRLLMQCKANLVRPSCTSQARIKACAG